MTDSETINRPLWQWSACELTSAIAAKQVSCAKVMESVVSRLHATNGRINAVVDDLSEAALVQARDYDREIAAGEALGPLHGVPVTIKENIDQNGRATPNGVTAYAGVIAADDSPVVRNLCAAGAIVVGRTNTPEFSFRATTVNELHGRTYNPWNDWASAGGSSGGAAAAAMMGYAPLNHGNDIGGSLRFPAAACGAATIKPGLGRTPAYNPSAPVERGMLAQIMSVQGIIAREVRDVRLGMRSLVRYDAHDPWMVPMPFDGDAPEEPITVGFTKQTFEFDLHSAVSDALDAAREALVDAGYIVREMEPPLLREAAEMGGRCLFGETILMLGTEIEKHGSDTLKRIFTEYGHAFTPLSGDDLLHAMAERARFVRAWTTFLNQTPLMLTPFMLQPTFAWDRDTQGPEGVREVLHSAIYSYAMNFLGLPAGNVPAAYNDGLPLSVQIVGRRFREDMILDALEAIESRVGTMAPRLWARD